MMDVELSGQGRVEDRLTAKRQRRVSARHAEEHGWPA